MQNSVYSGMASQKYIFAIFRINKLYSKDDPRLGLVALVSGLAWTGRTGPGRAGHCLY